MVLVEKDEETQKEEIISNAKHFQQILQQHKINWLN